MDIQELNAFLTVAELASFSRAGEQLHLSQPAVSKRIASLESRLGQRLLDRVGRRVLLTDAGRTLLPYARDVQRSLADGRRALSHMQDQISGRLSIGTSHHVGLHRLPPVLREFTRHYPTVDLDIHFMDSEVACQQVLAGDLELAIVTLPLQPDPQLETQLIWNDPMTVVVASDHPLTVLDNPGLDDLGQHPAVLPDAQTFTYRIICQALEEHGLEPHIRMATNYLETLKMLVAIGLGWSVLPCSMLNSELCALRVAGLALSRKLGLVRHRGRVESAAARKLAEHARAGATKNP